MKIYVVWAPTRVQAKVKARKAGARVGRVTLIPTERFERVKAWMIESR